MAELSAALLPGCGRGLSGGKSGRERGGGAEEGDLKRREEGMARAPGGGALRVRLCGCREGVGGGENEREKGREREGKQQQLVFLLNHPHKHFSPVTSSIGLTTTFLNWEG